MLAIAHAQKEKSIGGERAFHSFSSDGTDDNPCSRCVSSIALLHHLDVVNGKGWWMADGCTQQSIK